MDLCRGVDGDSISLLEKPGIIGAAFRLLLRRIAAEKIPAQTDGARHQQEKHNRENFTRPRAAHAFALLKSGRK